MTRRKEDQHRRWVHSWEGLTKCEAVVVIGCSLAAWALGFLTVGVGFAFGIYCGLLAAGGDYCDY